MSIPRACLGEDVLRPRFLRDTLLRLADSKYALFEPVWSKGILDRLAWDLSHGRSIPKPVVLEILGELRSVWPKSEVVPDSLLVAQLQRSLNPQDAETVAAASAGGADTLVTGHPGDFPDPVCAPLHIFSCSPDRFLRELFIDDRERMVQILTRMVAGFQENISFRDFLGGLLVADVEQLPYDLIQFRSIIDLEKLTDDWRMELRRQ